MYSATAGDQDIGITKYCYPKQWLTHPRTHSLACGPLSRELQISLCLGGANGSERATTAQRYPASASHPQA